MGFAGSGAEASTPPGAGDDDPLKWEKMYYSPAQGTAGEPFGAQDDSIDQLPPMEPSDPTKSEIRVVTFDLDNTIWKTTPTISDANDALAAHLNEQFGIAERSEKRMGQLFKQYPNRYAGVDFSEDDSINGGGIGSTDGDDYANIVQNVGRSEINFPADAPTNGDNGVHIQATFDNKQGGQAKKRPVYLTLLRKDAIRSLIQEMDGVAALAPVDVEDYVDSAFEVWIEARCQSISRNFAPFAVPTLMNLRQQLAADDSSSRVYIGAITDGNSDPNRVNELSGVFDFVIRAEDVGASKPDRRVYQAAVAALMLKIGQEGHSVEEFFLGESVGDGVAADTYVASELTIAPPSWKDIDGEAVDAFSEAVGPWWVHVGDDFFKDVVAAKECQMRTVWTRELVGGDTAAKGNMNRVATDGKEYEKKQRTVNDLVNDVSKSDGALKMTIGESDFLSESLHDEFCDAVIERLGDLSGLLMRWHGEGKSSQSSSLSKVNFGGNAEVDESGWQQTAMDGAKKDGLKFCVFCGSQLPAVAKFCASCGEKQS